MKRPTPLRSERFGWVFDGVNGKSIGPLELDQARVARISEMERYIDYLEEQLRAPLPAPQSQAQNGG